jgi:hypothetical protein
VAREVILGLGRVENPAPAREAAVGPGLELGNKDVAPGSPRALVVDPVRALDSAGTTAAPQRPRSPTWAARTLPLRLRPRLLERQARPARAAGGAAAGADAQPG